MEHLPVEIIREIIDFLDAESITALILSISGSGSKTCLQSTDENLKWRWHFYQTTLAVLHSCLPQKYYHIHPRFLERRKWCDLQSQGLEEDSKLALAISKFAWPKVHPSVHNYIHKLELVDGFFDRSGWHGTGLSNLAILELHGMKIKNNVFLPLSLQELTLVDCYVESSHRMNCTNLINLNKVELYRGDGELLLPHTITHLINGRMWVLFDVYPQNLVKLNDWTDTRRDVISALINSNWSTLKELLISLTWKIPRIIGPSLQALESGEAHLPQEWLPNLTSLGIDVQYWAYDSNVWRQGCLNLIEETNLSHITSLTLFVNEPGIKISSIPPLVKTLWVEGEDDCYIEEIRISSTVLTLCTIYFCAKVILDCPLLSDIELSYCNGGLSKWIRLPSVITDLSIDASDQANKVIQGRSLRGRSIKLVNCILHDCKLAFQEIHLERCTFINCSITSASTLELNLAEACVEDLIDIFDHVESSHSFQESYVLDINQLTDMLSHTLRHLEFRNVNHASPIRGDEFYHLVNLQHLTLGCTWIDCLHVPPNVEEVIFENITIGKHVSPMELSNVKLIAMKCCHFETLLYQDLGRPPFLRWLFVALCPDTCCAQSKVNRCLFPVDCRVIESNGIKIDPPFI